MWNSQRLFIKIKGWEEKCYHSNEQKERHVLSIFFPVSDNIFHFVRNKKDHGVDGRISVIITCQNGFKE